MNKNDGHNLFQDSFGRVDEIIPQDQNNISFLQYY